MLGSFYCKGNLTLNKCLMLTVSSISSSCVKVKARIKLSSSEGASQPTGDTPKTDESTDMLLHCGGGGGGTKIRKLGALV